MENDKTYLGRIKDSVDFIYALVTEKQDGFCGGFHTFGAITQRCAGALVKRGVLIRKTSKRDDGKKGVAYLYTWGSNLSPTKNLYKTIMNDLREVKKQQNARRVRRVVKQNGLTPVSVFVEETKEIPAPVIEQVLEAKKQYVTELDGFSAQELWDELKRRGYSIEDNRLVIIKKAYLD